jgi:hypothetical protein
MEKTMDFSVHIWYKLGLENAWLLVNAVRILIGISQPGDKKLKAFEKQVQ